MSVTVCEERGGERMIFDEIAAAMAERFCRAMSRKTGLSRDKVLRMRAGLPFFLDYNVVYALGRLGYHLELVEDSPDPPER